MSPCAAALLVLTLPVALLPAPARAVTFTKVTTGVVVQDAAESTGGAWEDFDGDGDPDLFVSCGNLLAANNRLYRNDLGLFFAPVPGPVASDSTPSIGGAWGDLDGDGDPDLHVSNRQGVDNLLYRNDGAGAFAPVSGIGPVTSGGNSNSASWVDIDRDGDLDLFVINFNETNRHWRNDGGGVFTGITTGPHVTETTFSISGVWSDYDRDGDPDLYVANGGSQHNNLYRNDGTTFTNVTAGALLQHGGNTIGASWGDWDNDGWSDLVAINTLNQNEILYRNLGNGTFERILTGPVVADGGSSVGSAFGDMDNDGDLDLLVGNDGTDNALYRNDGGTFTKVTTGAIVTDGGQTFGVSWADWNGDGWLDAFAANRLGEDDFLYTNDGGSNHHLQVALTGTVSNRPAIGARVEVYAVIDGAPVRQMRERQSQSGYNSAADPRLHFGLGDASTVDSLVVAWPSGLVETLRDVAADQVLPLVEGATLTAAPEGPPAAGGLGAVPNPSRGGTAIRWAAPRGSSITVRVYDLRGRVVRALPVAPGATEAVWDGRDAQGRPAAAGTYFAVAAGGGRSDMVRITRLR